jgi:hypothetical protein
LASPHRDDGVVSAERAGGKWVKRAQRGTSVAARRSARYFAGEFDAEPSGGNGGRNDGEAVDDPRDKLRAVLNHAYPDADNDLGRAIG